METPSPPKPRRWRHLRFHGIKSTTTTASPSPLPVVSAEDGVLRQGFLLKKGHRVPTTKDRFFVLRPRLLSYFRAKQPVLSTEASSPSSTPPTSPSATSLSLLTNARHLRGVIELAPSDLITPMTTSRHWFLLQKLHGPDGKPYKLELRASSPEERQEWIDTLRAAARDPLVTASQTARDAARERQLTQTLTMLHVRDATLLSTVLRQQQTPTQNLKTAGSVMDLRASFQIFHELVLLQSLITEIESDWGSPSTWSCAQYDTLVHSIALAAHQANSNPAGSETTSSSDASVLQTAKSLQYAFEEVPANQQKLLTRREQWTEDLETGASLPPLVPLSLHGTFVRSASSSSLAAPVGRVRCPTIYSYLSTFERLAPQSPTSSSIVDNSAPLSPRSATLAKYAHLYLEEEGHSHTPWRWDRSPDDDLVESTDASTSLSAVLADRFLHDQIYAYVAHHTLLFVNPNRMLKTAKFTSIYDEHVVLTYAQTPFAMTQLAPHPFAMAKQALFRLFYNQSKRPLSMVLAGDSGSGKTELAKELLKYTVLLAQPSSFSSHTNKVVLYTSSTKSTFQMRNEETRTLDLLHAKGITDYEVVLLDLTPTQWPHMTSISKSKRLPQVHVDGLFFGFYETLQRFEDEEQLRLYLTNPLAAHKLSSVLDSNILLEAFAHAATPLNGNSSRYAKRVDIDVAFGRDPAQYQVRGCTITPFLLEKARVTNASSSTHERNFHVLYALVHGLNNPEETRSPQQSAMATTLCLDACTSDSFRYLQGLPSTSDRETAWSRKKDAERFQHIVEAMETVGVHASRQEGIFRVLSAVLWLGNLEFATSRDGNTLEFVGATTTEAARPIVAFLQELLALESVETLASLLLQRHVDMASTTRETFDVHLSVPQARHARDALARLLYETVFHYVVAQLNHATAAPRDDTYQTLGIVDLFGFEDFHGDYCNSLEQLCINFMTEKLAVAERQLVAAKYQIPKHAQDDEPVLFLFEHALGIFATLEEQTVLHQSVGDVADNDQKKNGLFVRYLYQRNAQRLAPQLSQLKQHALRFLVPHARGVVTYDAHDFVKKNSDAQSTRLLLLLETSQNPIVREMIEMRIIAAGGGSGRSSSSSGSLTSQFRTQIQHQISLLNEAEPLFLHCFRANSTAAWTSVTSVDADMLERQVTAHRLKPILSACRDASASVFEVAMDATLFQTRFQCLAPDDKKCRSSLCGSLEALLRQVLDVALDTTQALIQPHEDTVHVRTLQQAETLELLLTKRQYEAATRLQALARMVRLRNWYRALQRDRLSLTRELLELYGPQSMPKVEKTLRKYEGGREAELRLKIQIKRQEKHAMDAIASGLTAFLASTSGTLDTHVLDGVLRDPEIQRLIAQSQHRIVVALREMSLNPHSVLSTQLADPELRAFYQRMLALLQAAHQIQQTQDQIQQTNNTSVEDRVRWLVTKHKAVWHAVASRPSQPWAEEQGRLEEIGDAPEMLLFYADDDAFNAVFTAFVEAVEAEMQKPLDAREEDEEDANDFDTLVAQLQRVEFSGTLMAAMQGDPFFVEALTSPAIVTAVHQLMTDREAFGAAQHGGLRSPVLTEFFHRLVRLSKETKRQ